MSNEFITNSSDGEEEFRSLRIFLELLPKASNMSIDGAR